MRNIKSVKNKINKKHKKNIIIKKDTISKIVPYIIFGFTIFVLIYYITGPALKYINSDVLLAY